MIRLQGSFNLFATLIFEANSKLFLLKDQTYLLSISPQTASSDESDEFIDVDHYGEGVEPLKPWAMTAYQQLPLNALSRLVGLVFNGMELPVWSR